MRLAEELGVIQLRGVGVVTFLQGYLTTDAQALKANTLQGTAICNIKGRVLATLFGRLIDDGVEFVLSRELVEATCVYFSKYLIFNKIEVVDVSHSRQVVAYLGAIPSGVSRVSENLGLWVVNDPQPLHDEHTYEEWQTALITASLPVITKLTSEKFLPQMLNFTDLGWLDFNKGCYLGQEVIARVQHRGEVKRELAALHWQGTPPEVGMTLQPKALIIQTASVSPDQGYALAVVKKPAALEYQNGEETCFTQL